MQIGGRGTTGGKSQASRGAVAGSSHQAKRRGAAGSRAAAPGDKGKRPQMFVPQLSSSSSLLPPRQLPSAGSAKEGGQGGQSSDTEFATEPRSRAREPKDQGQRGGSIASAQADPPPETGSTATPQRPEGQSPPPKRRRADSGPKLQGPEFKIPESRWQYHGPKSA
ncbi:uncharacterized protein LOC133896855 [Phragmites australis]|uniref:uncharacterized protein LOC133896855 n=1 Tax=Phragmites australis TaxID=29695 RepID=UPI002D789C9B|nr:uncharacterized protein LOC133896855 [Phragmites australis]